jgi:oligopeptidase B
VGQSRTKKVYYEYMMKYAPMEKHQRERQSRTCSSPPDCTIHEWRTGKPAKYATRVRESVTNGARVLLKTDLSAGHFSASDRYQHFKQTAFRTRLHARVSRPGWIRQAHVGKVRQSSDSC